MTIPLETLLKAREIADVLYDQLDERRLLLSEILDRAITGDGIPVDDLEPHEIEAMTLALQFCSMIFMIRDFEQTNQQQAPLN